MISFLVVLAISPLLSMLPDCVLNVILFCAVVPLVDWKMPVALVRLGRQGCTDLLALGVAFVATCFLGVVQGMLLAVCVSLVEFVWKSLFPQVSELHRAPGSLHYVRDEPRQDHGLKGKLRMNTLSALRAGRPAGKTVKVYRFEAPLWFANTAGLSDLLLSELRAPSLRGIVMDMSTVPWMDNTAATILKKALVRAEERRVLFMFASVNAGVKHLLEHVCHVREQQFASTLYAAEMAVRSASTSAAPREGDLDESPTAVVEVGPSLGAACTQLACPLGPTLDCNLQNL